MVIVEPAAKISGSMDGSWFCSGSEKNQNHFAAVRFYGVIVIDMDVIRARFFDLHQVSVQSVF